MTFKVFFHSIFLLVKPFPVLESSLLHTPNLIYHCILMINLNVVFKCAMSRCRNYKKTLVRLQLSLFSCSFSEKKECEISSFS